MGVRLGGRQKGTRNKRTEDVQAFVDAVFAKVEPKAFVKKLLESDDVKVQASVFLKLMEYRYGKPVQPLVNPDGSSLGITVINHIERPDRNLSPISAPAAIPQVAR